MFVSAILGSERRGPDRGATRRNGQTNPPPPGSPIVRPLPGAAGDRLHQALESIHPQPSAAYFIAFGGGAGLSRYAPGTAGTLAAFPLFWVLDYSSIRLLFCSWSQSMFLIGIWACGVTGGRWAIMIMAAWFGMRSPLLRWYCCLRPNGQWQAFAFLLFRLFDIIKPPPIGYYDQKLRGGFGVMFDDMLAAFLTLLCLAAWKALGMGL